VEGAEGDQEKSFEYMLTQFHKKHWKSIVHDIKLKLTVAQQEENQEKVNEILASFQELKKRLINEGLI